MRERRLILDASPCVNNLHAGGPTTLAEAKTLGHQHCPHFDACDRGFLDPTHEHQCAMSMGHQAAKFVLKNRSRLDKEIDDFRATGPRPPKGYVWSEDRITFVIITDFEEAVRKVDAFAEQILGGRDASQVIDERLAVGPTFNDVVRHSTTKDGAVDLRKMDELEGRYGSNGGRGCDVRSGPCSCGAWH